MGVSTNLYLSSRWDLRDIQKVVERTQGKKVKIESHHDFVPGFFHFNFGERSMSVFTNNPTPIGSATCLSLASNPEAHKILTDIAEVLGGIFMENDYDGKCELIDGNMYEGNGLPFLIKYAIINDGIDPEDIPALLASIQKFNTEIVKKSDRALDDLLAKAKSANDKASKE